MRWRHQGVVWALTLAALGAWQGGPRPAGAEDPLVRLELVATLTSRWERGAAPRGFQELSWDPRGRTIAALEGGEVSLWNARTGLRERTIARHSVSCVVHLGDRIVYGTENGHLGVVDAKTCDALGRARLSTDRLLGVSGLGSATGVVIAATESGTLFEVDVRAMRVRRKVELERRIADFAISPKGDKVAVAGEAGAGIIDWATGEGAPVKWFARVRRAGAVIFTENGRSLLMDACVNEELAGNELVLVDAVTGAPARRIARGDPGATRGKLAATSDTRRIAWVAGADRRRVWLGLYDATRGRLAERVLRANHEVALAFSPDGRRLAVGRLASPDRLTFLDAESGEEIEPYEGPRGGITDLAFSPVSRELVVTSTDGLVMSLHATPDGWRRAWSFERAGYDEEGEVAFSADGARLGVLSGDLVEIHEAATGKSLREQQLPSVPAKSDARPRLAFVSDTRTLLIAGGGFAVGVVRPSGPYRERELTLQHRAACLVRAPGRGQILLAGGRRVTLFDVASGDRVANVAKVDEDREISGVALVASTVVTIVPRTIRGHDLDGENEELFRRSLPSRKRACLAARAGVVAYAAGRSVELCDAKGRGLGSWESSGDVTCVSVSHDGRLIAIGHATGDVQVLRRCSKWR